MFVVVLFGSKPLGIILFKFDFISTETQNDTYITARWLVDPANPL